MITSSLKPKSWWFMRNYARLPLVLPFLCCSLALAAQQPISLSPDASISELTAALDGPQARISNLTLRCPEGAYALFNGDNTDLGQRNGVLLTTGKALNAIGPNDLGNAGNEATPARLPGDADLDALSVNFGDNTESIDACVLEMDVVSETGEIVFDYTFGSDEYPEFANNPDRFNDIFALLISGPGITGTQNLAVLPNAAATVVQIDSVNENFNSDFFRDNTGGQSLEYDGLTQAAGGGSLQARALVQPCQPYRLKFAIADRGDELFDSGVFLSAVCGGFPEVEVSLASGVDYLLEGNCTVAPDTLVLSYDNPKNDPLQVDIAIGGTATRGADYNGQILPIGLVFAPGPNRFAFPIVIVDDGVVEGEETLEVNVSINSDCGPASVIASTTIRLLDEIDLQITNVNEQDSIFYCAGGTVELTAAGAEAYDWVASNGAVSGGGATIVVTPDGDGTIAVTGTVGSCQQTVTLDLVAAAPSVEILNPDTVNICLGDTVLLEQSNNVNDQNLMWRPADGLLDGDNAARTRVQAMQSRYYAVSVGPEGCMAQDSVWIDVDEFVVPTLVNDTTHCGSTNLQLIVDRIDDTGSTVYNWSPGLLLNDSTDVNAILNLPFMPERMDTLFTLISEAENGACRDSQSVLVTITPAALSINGGMDTLFRCDDEGPVMLTADTNPGGGTFSWSPAVNITGGDLNSATIEVDPVDPQMYYVDAIVNGCPLTDSILVRTDSLPDDMSLTLDPVKDPYCEGDTFTIKSPTYDVGDYPLIGHEWLIAPGIASPQDLYNAVVFASDSALFTRINQNGACGDTSFIQVNVIKIPQLIFEPDPARVCPGEPLQINVSFGPGGPEGTLEWEDPDNTLSCDDCLDPVAIIQSTTEYMIEVTAEGSECTSPSMYTIEAIEDIPPTLTDQTLLCPGDSRRLITGNVIDGYTYRITGGGVDSTDPNVEVMPTEASTTYTVETTGECGTTSQTVTLDVAQPINISIDAPSTICFGEEVILTATIDQERNGEFTWQVGNTGTQSGQQITVTLTETTVFNVNFVDALCNEIALGGPFTVNVTPALPTPQAVGVGTENDTVVISNGGSIDLTVIDFPDEPGTTYNWEGNPALDPASGSGRTITVSAPREGGPSTSIYTVNITTADGCTTSAMVTIIIQQVNFQFPELISPNGDGTNDRFRVFFTNGAQVTDYNLIVFNRWGQKIYTSSDPLEGWDGTKNGTPQNQDTYLYISNFRLNGVDQQMEGQFVLIR